MNPHEYNWSVAFYDQFGEKPLSTLDVGTIRSSILGYQIVKSLLLRQLAYRSRKDVLYGKWRSFRSILVSPIEFVKKIQD